jgi:hypothetical protein
MAGQMAKVRSWGNAAASLSAKLPPMEKPIRPASLRLKSFITNCAAATTSSVMAE